MVMLKCLGKITQEMSDNISTRIHVFGSTIQYFHIVLIIQTRVDWFSHQLLSFSKSSSDGVNVGQTFNGICSSSDHDSLCLCTGSFQNILAYIEKKTILLNEKMFQKKKTARV